MRAAIHVFGGERAVLKRRDDYWAMGEDGQPLPYLDEIIYIDQGEDQTAAISALKAGQIDHIYDVQPATWEALKDEEGIMVDAVGTARTRILRMRVDKEPWTDERVRKALESGDAVIYFDPETETCSIRLAEER